MCGRFSPVEADNFRVYEARIFKTVVTDNVVKIFVEFECGAVAVACRIHLNVRRARKLLPEHCDFVFCLAVAQDGDARCCGLFAGTFLTCAFLAGAASGIFLNKLRANKLREPCGKGRLAGATREEAPDYNEMCVCQRFAWAQAKAVMQLVGYAVAGSSDKEYGT